ncbi:hypothetical protein TorRG33x02_012980 [Trema orientale]|uniref:Uncharacterized protein n=1 Tax=Trema orientale TaxID=63057 RepID=A0A2P5FZP1_TREOI|nr:hypothetical protein TorRG33x02_012980 [Trema orientale]
MLYKIAQTNWFPRKHTSSVGEAHAKFIYALGTDKPVDLAKWMFNAIVASGQSEATIRILPYPNFIQALINSYSPDVFMNKAPMNLLTQLTMKTFQSHCESAQSITVATALLVSKELKSLGLKPNSWIAQFEQMMAAKMADIENLLQTVITHFQIPRTAYSTVVPDDSTAPTLTPVTTQGEPVQPVPTAPNAPL